MPPVPTVLTCGIMLNPSHCSLILREVLGLLGAAPGGEEKPPPARLETGHT